MAYRLSIIIVHYKTPGLLLKCLRSLYLTDLLIEIIVVDNHSNDNSVEIIKREYPLVKLIENKENKGFSSANNQGIQIAKSENILLLNPDTEVNSDTLEKLILFLETQKSLCIIGPGLLNSDLSLQMSAWKYPWLSELLSDLFFLNRFLNRNYNSNCFSRSFCVEALSGAALLFKKQLTEKIGLLDDNLFWMEDVDFCYRANKAGAAIIYYPYAEVIHHSGQSSKKNQKIAVSNQLLSKLKFFKKHKGKHIFILASVIIFFNILSRIGLFSILFPFFALAGEKLAAYFFTLKRFFAYVFAGNLKIN